MLVSRTLIPLSIDELIFTLPSTICNRGLYRFLLLTTTPSSSTKKSPPSPGITLIIGVRCSTYICTRPSIVIYTSAFFSSLNPLILLSIAEAETSLTGLPAILLLFPYTRFNNCFFVTK